MPIELVNVEDVRTKRSGKTKGEKYSKYAQAVAKFIPWLEEQIDNSPDKKIRIKSSDIAKEMGGTFATKSHGAIYWGLKFVMFHNGIVVDTATQKAGDKLLVMRRATPDDALPASLTKYLDTDDEVPETEPETQ